LTTLSFRGRLISPRLSTRFLEMLCDYHRDTPGTLALLCVWDLSHGERFGSSLTQTHHTHPTSAALSNKNIPKVSIRFR
jgi:hypothetical protein